MPGEPFWLCHECRAEMRPIERNGVKHCASCDGEFIEILDEEINPDPYQELPHPPTRPGQYQSTTSTSPPRLARFPSNPPSPSPDDNPGFFANIFNSLLGQQPGQQSSPPGPPRSGNQNRHDGDSAIPGLGSPAAMHGQRAPQTQQGRSYDFNLPGGGSGRIVFGGFGGGTGGGGGGFMLGGGSGGGGGPPRGQLGGMHDFLQGGAPPRGMEDFFPGFPPPPGPAQNRNNTHQQPFNPFGPTGSNGAGQPEDQFLQALMHMLADEHGMTPNVLFGGMPGFMGPMGMGPRGNANLGDYVTSQQGFEDILERLMQAAGPQGPIPATDAVIEGLPRFTFDTKEAIEESKHKDCPVCKDDFVVGDEVMRIPCGHLFHPDCLQPWLKQNGSCPVCRFSLVPEGGSPTSPTAGTGISRTNNAQSPSQTSGTTQTSSYTRSTATEGNVQPDTRSQPQSPTGEGEETFFTSILNRLWGQAGAPGPQSPTAETFPTPNRPPPPAAPSTSGGTQITYPPPHGAPPSPPTNRRLADLASSIPLPPSPTPNQPHPARSSAEPSSTPDAEESSARAGANDPIIQQIAQASGSVIPDDYRERHRQREREQDRREREAQVDQAQGRRDLPHDDLD